MYSFSYLEPVLTIASWPAYRFLRRQVRWSGIPISWRIFVCCEPHKGFGIVNKAEVDVFLELFCFFCEPVVFGNLISGSSAFSKSSLNIWKFMVHILLKPGLENFKHYFASVWDDFSSPVATAEFSKFAGILNAALSQHHLLGFEIAQLEWSQVGLRKHHYEQSWGDGIHLHNHLQIISVDISLILFFSLWAVLGLCCCTQAFSSCRERGLLSSCSAQASRGFSCCGARALGKGTQ